MPGHKDPEYQVLKDEKGLSYVRIIRDDIGKPVTEPGIKVVKEETPREPEVSEVPKTDTIKIESEAGAEEDKYTKEELYEYTKKDQIEILKHLGLDSKEAKKIRTEEERVNKILEIQ